MNSNPINLEKLGQELGRIRTKNGHSFRDIEKLFPVSQSTLCRIENLESDPDMDNFLVVAAYLNMPPESFLSHYDGKVIYYPNAPFAEILRAVLYADGLDFKSINLLTDLMDGVYQKNINN